MDRTSPVHYIAPSAISITPNANGSSSDLAVYVAKGAKIKVFCKKAGIDYDRNTNTYQEWEISGRNRRLGDATGTVPYTIYARLNKSGRKTGYLVFAKKKLRGSEWVDAYSSVTNDTVDGYSVLYTDDGVEVRVTSPDYYYIRLGDVSIAENGQRTVTLDTGILGTDQFNDEWVMDPDLLPLRIELGCTIDDEDVGQTPYVYWGQSLILTATLTEGWTGTDIQRFDHWEITRNTGDEDADVAWNHPMGEGSFHPMSEGQITLQHARGVDDDFNRAVAATFTITAMGRLVSSDSSVSSDSFSSDSSSSSSSSQPELVALKTAVITVLAETVEKYELALSANIVGYNPQTQEYDPGSIIVRIRAIDQRSDVFELTKAQMEIAHLAVEYAAVGSDIWTPIIFSGAGESIAEASINTSSLFAKHQNLNVRIVRVLNVGSDSSDSSSSSSDAGGEINELAKTTIAFVRDGEDSKEREWIFLRSTEAITFGTQEHPYPAAVSGGEVNPTGAANGNTPYDNTLDGWVPKGWWDEQQGVDDTNRFEYGSYRNYIRESDSSSSDSSGSDSGGYWGPFITPKIWNHFGKDGIGIVNVTRTYGISASGTTASDTTSPSDITVWSAGSPQVTTEKPYLWVKEETAYTDVTMNTTKYYCVGKRGDNGVDAKDVEWAYIRTTTPTAPTILNDSTYTDSNSKAYTADGHLPRVDATNRTDIEKENSGNSSKYYECTDDPRA